MKHATVRAETILLPALVALALCPTACTGTSPSEPPENPLGAPPIDSARVGSVDEVTGWAYARETSADLDGDGQAERIRITADVQRAPGGAPLWEDGHRWAVLVTSPTDERTLLYGAFVPHGFAEAAVLTPDPAGRRRILVQERSPQQVRALEVEYLGPGAARSASTAYYHLETWLPGAASLR